VDATRAVGVNTRISTSLETAEEPRITLAEVWDEERTRITFSIEAAHGVLDRFAVQLVERDRAEKADGEADDVSGYGDLGPRDGAYDPCGEESPAPNPPNAPDAKVLAPLAS
jgi:hypothetical protein